MSLVDEIFALFEQRGAGAYYGEPVSMTEHMLQAAYFAQAKAAPAALVIAALLHDVGHLIETVPDDIADWTTDARHEEVGSRWLAQRFPAAVSEPVRLHVPAKRYLCATESAYFAKLQSGLGSHSQAAGRSDDARRNGALRGRILLSRGRARQALGRRRQGRRLGNAQARGLSPAHQFSE